MRQRHVNAERINARVVLSGCRIPLGEDFHLLTRAQVDALLVEADRTRYQQPRNANGSRARYFHDLMQRRAK
jgi:hypothetical protein